MGPYIRPLARNENVSALYANFAVKYYHPGINRYLCDRNTPSGIGSPTRARTWDLRINSPSLYQLSYRGTEEAPSMLLPDERGAHFNLPRTRYSGL